MTLLRPQLHLGISRDSLKCTNVCCHESFPELCSSIDLCLHMIAITPPACIGPQMITDWSRFHPTCHPGSLLSTPKWHPKILSDQYPMFAVPGCCAWSHGHHMTITPPHGLQATRRPPPFWHTWSLGVPTLFLCYPVAGTYWCPFSGSRTGRSMSSLMLSWGSFVCSLYLVLGSIPCPSCRQPP